MDTWMLVDAYNLAFRSFYGMPDLTRKDGFPIGALYGWIRALWKIQETYRPKGIGIFFDLGPPERQLKLLPEYKSHRPETPDALKAQIPWIKKITEQMGCRVIEHVGIEADEAIGAYAHELNQGGQRVLIASSDKDFAQCVNEHTHWLRHGSTPGKNGTWQIMDAQAVFEKYAVWPKQIPLYLSLIGDSADHIPGVPGVGPKTAAQWLQNITHLDDFWTKLPHYKPQRARDWLLARPDFLSRNLQLIEFNLDLIKPNQMDTLEPLHDPATPLFLETLHTLELYQLEKEARNGSTLITSSPKLSQDELAL